MRRIDRLAGAKKVRSFGALRIEANVFAATVLESMQGQPHDKTNNEEDLNAQLCGAPLLPVHISILSNEMHTDDEARKFGKESIVENGNDILWHCTC